MASWWPSLEKNTQGPNSQVRVSEIQSDELTDSGNKAKQADRSIHTDLSRDGPRCYGIREPGCKNRVSDSGNRKNIWLDNCGRNMHTGRYVGRKKRTDTLRGLAAWSTAHARALVASHLPGEVPLRISECWSGCPSGPDGTPAPAHAHWRSDLNVELKSWPPE